MKLTREGREQFPQFLEFSCYMLDSEDIDPLYPVLSALMSGTEYEEALWMSFLYVAWYNLPSGRAAYLKSRWPHESLVEDLDATWPTGTERRSNRGGVVRKHIQSWLELTGGDQKGWLAEGLRLSRKHRFDNWRLLNERLQTVWGNGRWAAYKHLEVLRRVHGLNVEAPDMGNQFSSGPRKGLALFFGPVEGQSPEAVAELDEQGLYLQQKLAEEELRVDIEELETLLCNWNSMVKGRYYVGHDCDELQEQILVAEERGILTPKQAKPLWEARAASLPREYLGELGGWKGVDKKRQRAYRDLGLILTRS